MNEKWPSSTGVWSERRGCFGLIHAQDFLAVRCDCGESITFDPKFPIHDQELEAWKQRHETHTEGPS